MTDAVTVRKNGKAEMAYVGETPWHGLGQVLKPGASIDEWLVAAGMDWDIKDAAVQFQTAEGAPLTQMKHQRVLFRSDSLAPLSVVSDEYKVVQPRAVLDYFRKLVDGAGFTIDTAGTLFGGRKFWALATVGQEAAVRDPKDKVRGRLLLATSADCSLATIGKFVHERVVCANTLTMALRESGTAVKMQHRADFDPEKMDRGLGIQVGEAFGGVMERLRKLADIKLDKAAQVKATIELYKPDCVSLTADELLKEARSKSVRNVARLAITDQTIGHELDGATGTAWGWLNAVTEYIDHDNGARTADRRLQKAWFGRGDKLKTRAAEIAQDIAAGGKLLNRKFKASDDALVAAIMGD